VTRASLHAGLLSAAVVFATAAGAAAQTRPPDPAPPTTASPAQTSDATADEDYELDIGQRRITERDFHAATEVSVGDAEPGGLDLRVGARVRAGEIDVLLRNVRGRVRFRASLAPVLRLLDARRGRNQIPFRW
jgi:hypothetical protein